MSLHIGLHDGFSNDTVTIRVDGKEVFRKAGVTSNLAIAYADAVDIPVGGKTARLEVIVADGESLAQEVRVAETPFVAVRRVEGTLQMLTSADPFPML